MDLGWQLHHLSRTDYDAVVFDLDGVLTRTARLHALSWKAAFDELLARRAAASGAPFIPFDADADYVRYVDGKPRLAGAQAFLDARGIVLPEGIPGDAPERETLYGVTNHKHELFLRFLREHGIDVYPSSIALLSAVRAAGFRTGLVSSSKSVNEIIGIVGVRDQFDVVIDGNEGMRLDLKGKPEPDTFVEAAKRLAVAPSRAVVIEDAVAGVEAGHRGGFAVIGVDRRDHRSLLEQAGADVVVADLAEITVAG